MARDRQELIQAVLVETRALHNDIDRFDDAACERLGVNRTDLRCLDILGQSTRDGVSITAGELAEQAGLTSGAITGIVDRLERAGYVRRATDQRDRRRVVVSLTPKALRRAGEIWEPLAADAAGLLASYSERDLRAVLDHIRRDRALSARHLERVKRRSAPRPR